MEITFGDSPACCGGEREITILPFSNPKSSGIVIPRHVAVERGGDVRESPFCHFQSLNPPKARVGVTILPFSRAQILQNGDSPACRGREGRGRTGITILPPSKPKSSKMVIPPAGGGGRITILPFSEPKISKIVIPPACRRGEGHGNHHFAIFRDQILQNGDSACCGGEGWGRTGITILPFSEPKSSKMVIPRVAGERGGDTRESPFCHFQSPNPPKWWFPVSRGRGVGTHGNHHFAIFRAQFFAPLAGAGRRRGQASSILV